MNNKEKAVEIGFAELSDGSLVETIEDPSDTSKTLLAIYDNNSVLYTERLLDQDRILTPLSRAENDLAHVCLASGVEPCGRLEDLRSDIDTLLSDCLDLDVSVHLMSAFVISTWFPEKLSIAPYLAFIGPPGSGKTTAMRILSLLCYRSLLTADISSSAFYDISDRIRPTVLLDETLTAGDSRQLIHLLKVSSTPDYVFLRQNKARLAFGPKVFSWLKPPDDQALNSRCVIVPMYKTSRTDLKNPRDPGVLACARKIRMRLLQLRFERFRAITEPTAPLDGLLSGRPLDLYRALALPFGEDESFCKLLADRIGQQDKFQEPLLSPAQLSVIRVLYDFIHECPGAYNCRLSNLAAAVNSDLQDRHEPSGLNERKIGSVLTSLSFTRRDRQNRGYVLILWRQERERIHESARDSRIVNSASLIEKCQICTPRKLLPTPPFPTSPTTETQIRTIEVADERRGKRREHRERRVHRSGRRLQAAVEND